LTLYSGNRRVPSDFVASRVCVCVYVLAYAYKEWLCGYNEVSTE